MVFLISLGREEIMTKSTKQKLNMDSMTVSELLVGCSDDAKEGVGL